MVREGKKYDRKREENDRKRRKKDMLEDMSKLEGMSKRKREDESIWRIFEKSRKK